MLHGGQGLAIPFPGQGRDIWRMVDVGYSGHADCFNGWPEDMVGLVFKIRPGHPVMVVARIRGLIEGVFCEEEVGPELIDVLGKDSL